jgi:cytochrome b561
MSSLEKPDHYAPSHKWIHWLTAAIVLGLLIVGLIMTNMEKGALRGDLYWWHKSFGVAVLALIFLRILIKVRKGVPAPVETLTRVQRIASASTHHLLYLLLVFVPLMGFIGSSACCGPISVFGLFNIPNVISGGMETTKLIMPLHKYGSYLLAALIIAHIGASFLHLLLYKDGVMARMLPQRDQAGV